MEKWYFPVVSPYYIYCVIIASLHTISIKDCASAKSFYVNDIMWVECYSICSRQKCTCTEHIHIYLCLCKNVFQLNTISKGTTKCKGNRYQNNIQNAKVIDALHAIYMQDYGGDFQVWNFLLRSKEYHNLWLGHWCQNSARIYSGESQEVLLDSDEPFSARHW